MRFKSVVNTSQQAILAIHKLYLKGQGLTLDPMYNCGGMYVGLPYDMRPAMVSDLHPMEPVIAGHDARNLPIADGTIYSLMLDPPWLITGKNPKGKMHDRYRSFETKEELLNFHNDLLKEAYRIIRTDGWLIVKTQDFIQDRRKFFLHHFVINVAMSLGFNLIDLFVQVAKSRMRSQTEVMSQAASESYHCYFLVFRKRKSRTEYSGPAEANTGYQKPESCKLPCGPGDWEGKCRICGCNTNPVPSAWPDHDYTAEAVASIGKYSQSEHTVRPAP